MLGDSFYFGGQGLIFFFFYMCSGDINSGSLDFMVSTLTHEANSSGTSTTLLT